MNGSQQLAFTILIETYQEASTNEHSTKLVHWISQWFRSFYRALRGCIPVSVNGLHYDWTTLILVTCISYLTLYILCRLNALIPHSHENSDRRSWKSLFGEQWITDDQSKQRQQTRIWQVHIKLFEVNRK